MTNLMASLLGKYGLAERWQTLENMVKNCFGAIYTVRRSLILDADSWR